ncbi:MAG: glycoside hydrolase family 5 protein [Clostridiales bacterium]|nr:glycoside hydrolase family 5 protein [Clostridiales bacterium]
MKILNNQFIKVKGKGFYKDGNPIKFTGLGIGTWLNLEHFMIGIPTTDQIVRETFKEVYGEVTAKQFFDKFIRQFITEDDFKFLKDMGINLVRVPFNYRLFIDDQHPEQLKQEGFLYFDKLIKLATKYEIYIMPDLHTTPGGQNPDWHADNQTGIPQFWHFKVFRDQMVLLWRKIAERYRNEEYILGYDVLNEPLMIPKIENILNDFYKDVTVAIREVDQNHIIFLEGDFFAMDFSEIHTIDDEQTALTFHYYPGVWDPELMSSKYTRESRKAFIDNKLGNLVKIRDIFNRPIICGETGFDIDKNNYEFTFNLIEDLLELFLKYDVSWILWCYKDAQYMGVVYPRNNSPWMKFVNKVRETWDHHAEIQLSKDGVKWLLNQSYGKVSDDLGYYLHFQQRALLYRIEQEKLLIPLLKEYSDNEIMELPDSFLFINCNYYQEYYNLLYKYSKKLLK